MNGHHRIEQKSKINALGLNREFECLTISIKRPGALSGGNSNGLFVGSTKKTLFECTVRSLIDNPNGSVSNWNDRDNRGNCRRFKTCKGTARRYFFNAHWSFFYDIRSFYDVYLFTEYLHQIKRMQ